MRILLLILISVISLNSFSQLDTLPERIDISHLKQVPSTDILKYKGVPYTGIAYKKSNKGGIESEYQFKEGYRKGLATFYHDNGEVYLQGDFDLDKRVGEWKAFYPNGDLMQLTPYVNGVRDGLVKSYIKSNHLTYHVNYQSGSMHGLFVILDTLGDTLSKGMYDRGFKSGQWLEYSPKLDSSYSHYYKTYDEKLGDLPELVGWKDLEEDENRWYYENVPYTGRRIQRKNGKIGAPIVNEMVLEDGWPLSYKTWYPDGEQLLMEASYKNGLADGRWNYYRQNGDLMRFDEFKDGKKHGESKVFHSDGNLSTHYRYKDDMYHGKCMSFRYNPKGVKEWERNYVRDTLHGVSKEYHQNGKLAVENNYNMGLRDKMQYHYDEAGKLLSKALYKDGKRIEQESFYENGNRRYKSNRDSGMLNGPYKEWFESGQLKTEGNYKYQMKEGEWVYYFDGNEEVKMIETYRNDSLMNSQLDLAGNNLYAYEYPDDFETFIESLEKVINKKKTTKLKDFFTDSVYTKIPINRDGTKIMSSTDLLDSFESDKGHLYWAAIKECVSTGIGPLQDSTLSKDYNLPNDLLINYHFAVEGIGKAFKSNEITIPKTKTFGVYEKPDPSSKPLTFYTAYISHITDFCTNDIGSSTGCWFKITHKGKSHFVKSEEVSNQFSNWRLLFGKVNGEWKIVALFN